MKILIADDDKGHCIGLKKYLQKKHAYQVDIAFDGDEAKHFIEKEKYDIIILDCDMPFIPGISLVRIIKKENADAKIIMVSGYAGIEEKFAKYAGVFEFLRKPFPIARIDEIFAKVRLLKNPTISDYTDEK